ncbi:DUF87 domain-containing protein [Bradyrhizobium sp. LjRoot220]|uniref:helicase HerA domain-containing protein n=1 Tax=Bradyrhizobium sp. LjRoot220 TaxID=3342284 RepID=UPI003ECEE5C0
MKHAIPDAVLHQHVAFLGKTGSGKTSTAKLAVEQIVRGNPSARVCVLDPIKSDWWGLTSSADGKKPGLPFHILGGPRGHVALHDSAGKAIGELVATGALPLSIIDMADFNAGGLQKFFNDFAPALMKKMRGVVYLVIEEAHEFAPKERSGIGAESMAIHFAKKLATAGRSKGIRMMVLTQRTQALHNALLGSCDTMIAHRLTAPADQAPVLNWLKANVGKEIFEKVSSSMSSLKTGSGWICSGEAQVADLVQFPKIGTYDNSATPTGDMADLDVKTAPVDREKLRSIIGDAVVQAEADDPKKLRAEIVRLQGDLATASAISPPMNPAQLADSERRGFKRGFDAAVDQASYQFEVIKTQIARATAEASEVVNKIAAHELKFTIAENNIPSDSPTDRPSAHAPMRSPADVARSAPRKPSPEASGDGSLTNPQKTLLRSLAWWSAMGHETVTRAQVSVIAGWSPSSSNVRDRLSEVSKLGFVEYPGTGMVRLTAAGDAAAPRPDMSATLVDSIRAILTNPQRTVFDALRDNTTATTAISRDMLSQACGWSPDSSNIRDRLSELSRLELVIYPRSKMVQLQSWVRG